MGTKATSASCWCWKRLVKGSQASPTAVLRLGTADAFLAHICTQTLHHHAVDLDTTWSVNARRRLEIMQQDRVLLRQTALSVRLAEPQGAALAAPHYGQVLQRLPSGAPTPPWWTLEVLESTYLGMSVIPEMCLLFWRCLSISEGQPLEPLRGLGPSCAGVSQRITMFVDSGRHAAEWRGPMRGLRRVHLFDWEGQCSPDNPDISPPPCDVPR